MSANRYILSAISDLTQHALQADLLEAEQQFDAVHMRAGGAMLFFIGSGDVLCVAKEESGREHGWRRADLSSAQTRRDFPWGASCRRFAVVQGESGAIDMAMVLSDGSDDHLYLSLANADDDTGWTDDPSWLACPFPADGGAIPPTIEIVNVLISDANDRYTVAVDIVANPGAPVPMLRRYVLDLDAPDQPGWILHSEAGPALSGHTSALGRPGSEQSADSIYTLGSFAGTRRLQYAALAQGTGRAAARQISVPGAHQPDAFALCRNADNSSGLFVVAHDTLFYFAAGRETHGAPIALLRSPLLAGTRCMCALRSGGTVVLWARNGEGQLFYVCCPVGQEADAQAWSRPLCTLAGVDAFSPFVDRLHGAMVVLARTSAGLVKSVKSPVTGLWNRRAITLPPSDMLQAPVRSSSYVTCIRVEDDAGRAVPDAVVLLSANSVTSVYINGMYWNVGPVPVRVQANSSGELTIVEMVSGLAGTRLSASSGGCTVAVNPMDDAFRAAAAMVQDHALTRAYQDVHACSGVTPPGEQSAPAGYADALASDVGDLFSWLESGIAHTIRIVHNSLSGRWHVVATIGGQRYHGVLDCVEKIVAATLWVMGSVKGPATDAEPMPLPAASSAPQPRLH